MGTEDKQKIAIFDLDGTIINGDSTIEFVNYFLRQQRSKKNYITFLINRFANYFIPLPSIRNTYRYKCIKLLKGYTLNTLQYVAKDFAKNYLSKIVNKNILEKACDLQNNGFKVFILSGSINLVVIAFANLYNFDKSWGSSLCFNTDNICQGMFKKDILNSKLGIVQFLSDKIDFSNSYGFSDNQIDSAWLKKFGYAYGVVNSYVDGDFWRKNNLETLYKIPALKVKKEFFYWPLGYYMYTRLTSFDYIFGIIVDFVLLPIILIGSSEFGKNKVSSISILISFLIFYLVYEIGYITNDQHAFKEKKPAYRVPQWSHLFTKKLIFVKVVSILIGLTIIRALGYNIVLTLICLGVLAGAYYLHNHVDNNPKFKMLSEFLLRVLRIIGPVIPFINHDNIYGLALMVTYIVLSRAIFWLLSAHTYKSGIGGRNTLRYSLIIAILKMLVPIICLMIFKIIGLINANNLTIYLFILLDLLTHPALTTLKYVYKEYKHYFNNPSNKEYV